MRWDVGASDADAAGSDRPARGRCLRPPRLRSAPLRTAGAALVVLVAPLLPAGPASGQGAPRGVPGDPRPTDQVPPSYRFSGELFCSIGGGATPLLGADRGLECTLRRRTAVAERYEGISGIVTGRTREAQTVVFAVWMPDPAALAALAGDFNGARVSASGDGALVGGVDDAVVLTPLLGRAATELEALNALLRLNQLHLNYGGRVPGRLVGGMAPRRPLR